MAQITTLDTVSKLLKYVTITLPPFVTKSDDSYIRQFLSSILEVFKINVDQLNQMFNNTFISEAEEGDLEKLILDVSNVTRKDGETDEDYRNRFYKYVYRYNATANSIEEIVYDTLGYYPIKLTESGARTAYWGLHDLVVEDRVANSAYFYDDVNEYTAYWGRYQSQQSSENEKYFVGIIHLTERPPQEKLDELCDVIERVRKKGTKIYLQFLDNIDIILEPVVTIVEEDAFTFAWRLVPSAFSYEVQIDDDPLFGSPTTYITSSTSYNFSGLSSGVTYYTRVRYENEDGYSEWTEPVETITPSLIGTPIATEETSVTAYGFTANWGSASGATSYLLTVATDLALTVPISGLNQLNVGNVVSFDINKISEERILYMRGSDILINYEGNLYSCKLDGTDIQQHTTTERVYNGATFVKNGDIVYSRNNGSNYKLYVIKKSENYSTEYELLDDSSNPLLYNNNHPKASKTLNSISYYKENPAVSTDLYIYDLDTNIELHLESEANKYYLPFWNNNSTFIYTMTIDVGDTADSTYIKKIKVNDGSITSIVDNNRPSLFPTIDLNEQYLFYAYNSSGIYSDDVDRIRRYKLDGTEDIDIINTGTTTFYSMGINSNNNKLYFCNKRSPHTTKFQLYKANLDGSSQELVFGSTVSYNDYLMDLKEITYDINVFPTIPSLSTLYYGVKATDGVITSPYSNVITVNKPIELLQKDSYTKMALNLNGNYLDSSTNGNNAIPINSPSFTAPLISGESNSLLLDGVNNVLELPNTISTNRTMTIRALFQYLSFTRPNTYLYTEWYGESADYNYIAKIIIEYDKTNNKFLIYLYDDSYGDTFNNTKYVMLETSTIVLTNTLKCLIQFSWDNTLKVAKFCMNNSEYSLSQVGGSLSLAILNLNDSISPRKIYWGGFTFPNSLDTSLSPNQILSKLYVDDGVARDLAYHQTDWANISPYL